jgi:hypothetical protein
MRFCAAAFAWARILCAGFRRCEKNEFDFNHFDITFLKTHLTCRAFVRLIWFVRQRLVEKNKTAEE